MSAWRPYRRDDPHSYAPGVFPCRELLTSGRTVLGLVVPGQPDGEAGLVQVLAEARKRRIPIVCGDRLLARLAGDDGCRAVGVFAKCEEEPDPLADHVVLVAPSDQGNLGTIMRTMLGFGVRDLVLIGTGADPHHPRTVRASMGACFHLRLARYATWQEYLAIGPRPLHPFTAEAAIPLGQAEFHQPCSLVFGTESSGLPSFLRTLGQPLRIVHDPAIDSLNLAIAAGISLHALAASRRLNQ